LCEGEATTQQAVARRSEEGEDKRWPRRREEKTGKKAVRH
jgi:hypothetical protein